MFFHPKILAKNIIKEIDKLEGDLYENHDRLELCLPKYLIEKFPDKKHRERLAEKIWNIFYKLKTYQIDRYCFTFQGNKYVLASCKKEWELEIKAYIKLWEGETEITLISPSYAQFDDKELVDLLKKENCKIIKFNRPSCPKTYK